MERLTVASAVKGKRKKTVMGIDSSSKSIAYAVLLVDGDNKSVVDYGKIVLPPGSMRDKLKVLDKELSSLLENQSIDIVVIEQTIYIQSPQTSRILSYVVGATFVTCLRYCKYVSDVQIMKWKNFIGYKNVTKAEIAEWTLEIGKKDAKKRAAFERKNRTAEIIKDMYHVEDIDDHDIMDAFGIATWAAGNMEDVINGTV